MFRKERVFVELTSEGAVTLQIKGKQKSFKVFTDLTTLLDNLPKNAEVFIALGRDTIIVHKATLPKEALDYLEESVEYILDDILPGISENLKVKPYVVSVGETLEVLIIGVDRRIYELCKNNKNVKLLTLSAIVLKSVLNKDDEIYNRLSEDKFEKIIVKNNKLSDIFLVNFEEIKNANNIVDQEDFLNLFSKTYFQNKIYEFHFINKIKREYKLKPLIGFALSLLIIANLYQGYIYWKHKEELNHVNEQLSYLKPYFNEYSQLMYKINVLQKNIDILKSFKSYALYILWTLSKKLPKDTWLISFAYSPGEIVIEGYTASTTKLLKILQQVKIFESIRLEGIPLKQNGYEKFKLRLKVKILVKK